jgi:hypothetical protein
MTEEKWSDLITEARNGIGGIKTALNEFQESLGDKDPSEPEAKLIKDMEEALSSLDKMSEFVKATYLCYISGYMPSKEQYFLFHSIAGEEWVNAKPHSEYELFCLFSYKDDEKMCFINPTLTPEVDESTPRENENFAIPVNVGVSPEELSVNGLRPEQKEFFQKYDPDTYIRFKQD